MAKSRTCRGEPEASLVGGDGHLSGRSVGELSKHPRTSDRLGLSVGSKARHLSIISHTG